MDWIEWLGYTASVLVALSLTMSSIVRLRWVNLFGAALFSGYGFLIAAMPVALLNGFIVLAKIRLLQPTWRDPGTRTIPFRAPPGLPGAHGIHPG